MPEKTLEQKQAEFVQDYLDRAAIAFASSTDVLFGFSEVSAMRCYDNAELLWRERQRRQLKAAAPTEPEPITPPLLPPETKPDAPEVRPVTFVRLMRKNGWQNEVALYDGKPVVVDTTTGEIVYFSDDGQPTRINPAGGLTWESWGPPDPRPDETKEA